MTQRAPKSVQMASTLVTGAVDWLQTVQRNRTIAAILLLVQGLNFILHPDAALTGMVTSVAMTVGIAALTSLIGCLAAPKKGRSTLRSMGICGLLLVLCICSYFRPGPLSSSLRSVIALVAIGLGISHLARAAKLSRMQAAVESVSSRFSASVSQGRDLTAMQEQAAAIEKSVEGAVHTHVLQRLAPALRLSEKYAASRLLTIVISAVMIAMGVLLFLYPFQTDALMMTLCGVTMMLGALSEIMQGHLLRISSLRAALRDILPGKAAS